MLYKNIAIPGNTKATVTEQLHHLMTEGYKEFQQYPTLNSIEFQTTLETIKQVVQTDPKAVLAPDIHGRSFLETLINRLSEPGDIWTGLAVKQYFFHAHVISTILHAATDKLVSANHHFNAAQIDHLDSCQKNFQKKLEATGKDLTNDIREKMKGLKYLSGGKPGTDHYNLHLMALNHTFKVLLSAQFPQEWSRTLVQFASQLDHFLKLTDNTWKTAPKKEKRHIAGNLEKITQMYALLTGNQCQHLTQLANENNTLADVIRTSQETMLASVKAQEAFIAETMLDPGLTDSRLKFMYKKWTSPYTEFWPEKMSPKKPDFQKGLLAKMKASYGQPSFPKENEQLLDLNHILYLMLAKKQSRKELFSKEEREVLITWAYRLNPEIAPLWRDLYNPKANQEKVNEKLAFAIARLINNADDKSSAMAFHQYLLLSSPKSFKLYEKDRLAAVWDKVLTYVKPDPAPQKTENRTSSVSAQPADLLFQTLKDLPELEREVTPRFLHRPKVSEEQKKELKTKRDNLCLFYTSYAETLGEKERHLLETKIDTLTALLKQGEKKDKKAQKIESQVEHLLGRYDETRAAQYPQELKSIMGQQPPEKIRTLIFDIFGYIKQTVIANPDLQNDETLHDILRNGFQKGAVKLNASDKARLQEFLDPSKRKTDIQSLKEYGRLVPYLQTLAGVDIPAQLLYTLHKESGPMIWYTIKKHYLAKGDIKGLEYFRHFTYQLYELSEITMGNKHPYKNIDGFLIAIGNAGIAIFGHNSSEIKGYIEPSISRKYDLSSQQWLAHFYNHFIPLVQPVLSTSKTI